MFSQLQLPQTVQMYQASRMWLPYKINKKPHTQLAWKEIIILKVYLCFGGS